jgi:hypothetical protein
MTGPYEGVHSFAFRYPKDGGATPGEIVEALGGLVNRSEGPLYFTSEMTPFEQGGFIFFAHTAKDSLEEQSAFYNDELWSAGIHTNSVQELEFHTSSGGVKMGIKRNSPTYCALVRIKVNDRPLTVKDRIAVELFHEELPFAGASHVTGGSPLVIELGAGSVGELSDAVEQVRGVEGVDPEKIQASWCEVPPLAS